GEHGRRHPWQVVEQWREVGIARLCEAAVGEGEIDEAFEPGAGDDERLVVGEVRTRRAAEVVRAGVERGGHEATERGRALGSQVEQGRSGEVGACGDAADQERVRAVPARLGCLRCGTLRRRGRCTCDRLATAATNEGAEQRSYGELEK